MEPIKVKKLSPNAILPTYGSVEAAGADLYACLDAPVTVAPGETAWIPTGLALEVLRRPCVCQKQPGREAGSGTCQ